MAIIQTLGRIAALLAAALLVTWGLYSFIDSDFAAGLPANRREMEWAEGGFTGPAVSDHDDEEHEARESAAGFVRPDGSFRPGRGEGGHHVGNAVDFSEAGEMIEPLIKVSVIVVAFVVFGRLFGRRKPQKPAPPRTPSSPPAGA